jgi:HlyD family secretion protein
MSSEQSSKAAGRTSARWFIRAGITAGAVLACAGGVLAVMTGTGARASQSERSEAERSDVATVVKQSFDVTTKATGELEAARQIEIRNQLEQPTTIIELVKEGTNVKQGEVLVRLNSEAIQTQIDEEMLRVEQSRAELSVAENAFAIQQSDNASAERKAQLKLDLARLDLQQWLEGEVRSKRQEHELALERADRELLRLREKYENAVKLHEKQFLSRDELQRDEVAFLEAKAQVEKAKLEKQVYEDFQFPRDRRVKESDVEQAVADLDRTRRQNESQLSTKEAERSNKRQQLVLREQKLARLREQLEACTIKAPNDGLVVFDSSLNRDRWGNSDQPLDVGRQVTRNQRLLVLPDTSEMVASVRVPESMTARIRKGQQASVRIDALGGRALTGVVESIGVIAESGGWRDPNLREYTVKVRLEGGNAEGRLKPSMRAEASLLLDTVSDALSVPIQAVFIEGMVRYVLVQDGGKFVRRPVRLGRVSERMAEIRAGLVENERVLLREATTSELIARPWDGKELAAAGLRLGEDGRVMPAMMPGAGGPGGGGGPGGPGMPGGGAPAGGPPGGRPAAGGAPAPVPAAAPAPAAAQPRTEAPAASPAK